MSAPTMWMLITAILRVLLCKIVESRVRDVRTLETGVPSSLPKLSRRRKLSVELIPVEVREDRSRRTRSVESSLLEEGRVDVDNLNRLVRKNAMNTLWDGKDVVLLKDTAHLDGGDRAGQTGPGMVEEVNENNKRVQMGTLNSAAMLVRSFTMSFSMDMTKEEAEYNLLLNLNSAVTFSSSMSMDTKIAGSAKQLSENDDHPSLDKSMSFHMDALTTEMGTGSTFLLDASFSMADETAFTRQADKDGSIVILDSMSMPSDPSVTDAPATITKPPSNLSPSLPSEPTLPPVGSNSTSTPSAPGSPITDAPATTTKSPSNLSPSLPSEPTLPPVGSNITSTPSAPGSNSTSTPSAPGSPITPGPTESYNPTPSVTPTSTASPSSTVEPSVATISSQPTGVGVPTPSNPLPVVPPGAPSPVGPIRTLAPTFSGTPDPPSSSAATAGIRWQGSSAWWLLWTTVLSTLVCLDWTCYSWPVVWSI